MEGCEHVQELRAYLVGAGLTIWSEHGEPDSCVNVRCEHCRITFQLPLGPRHDTRAE